MAKNTDAPRKSTRKATTTKAAKPKAVTKPKKTKAVSMAKDNPDYQRFLRMAGAAYLAAAKGKGSKEKRAATALVAAFVEDGLIPGVAALALQHALDTYIT